MASNHIAWQRAQMSTVTDPLVTRSSASDDIGDRHPGHATEEAEFGVMLVDGLHVLGRKGIALARIA